MMYKLKSIGPIDGRYYKYTFKISDYLSEYKIISNRILVEVRWLQYLVRLGITPIKSLSQESIDELQNIIALDTKMMHDVKAVEYYIRKRFEVDGTPELKKLITWVHIFCTSEDINSPSYSMGIRDCMNYVVKPLMLQIISTLCKLALENARMPMLSRTHGQPAIPTTFGKEVSTFVYRLSYQYKKCISNIGLVMFKISLKYELWFILVYRNLDLNISLIPHKLSVMILYQNCLIVFGEVGSSTMPHKINPIDLENAEGNLGLSNSLFHFFSTKLPMSRMQRDLSDSSVLRNLGVAFAHSVVAYNSILSSLERMYFDESTSKLEIQENWNILSEPVQLNLKMMGHMDAFEKVLVFTRGFNPSKDEMLKFIEENCGKDSRLLTLKLEEYLGIAEKLAKNVVNYLPKELS
uniref:Adenylosuccinate lyase, putative n=1 Tax=Theileria annulata TaxID=5874 RepID=A0A3B0MTT0_THEAN